MSLISFFIGVNLTAEVHTRWEKKATNPQLSLMYNSEISESNTSYAECPTTSNPKNANTRIKSQRLSLISYMV